jgi:hypothetical protein
VSFKYGAWEVEKTAMDVQADEAGLRPDPSATAIVERPVTDSQGQLFGDAYPTYADTDKIPAVGRSTARPSPARWLRILVVIVALVVVAAGATLGLVKSGVIDTNNTNDTGSSSAAQTTHHHSGSSPTVPLVTPVTAGNGTATYRVDIAAYLVTVTTSTGRSWVSIGAAGKHPTFEGVLNPNSTQKELLLGPSQVDVGAGGTKVTITSGKRTSTLTPVAAPFSYSFVINP